MTSFDITLPISGDLCVWPGDPPVDIQPDSQIRAGDGANTSRMTLGSHTGTHVDPPWHVVLDGKQLDEIPLERWCGPCHVARIPDDVARIERAHLDAASIPDGTRKLLLKTSNSALWDRPRPWTFEPSFVALGPDAAQWVVDCGIDLVGIDYLSIEPFDAPGIPVHRTLLANEVLILEGLDLRGIEPGPYTLTCLPMRLERGDGAPARAMLTSLS
jgi:arylformamidase